MKMLKSYTHTIYACYTAYITQAIVVNFAPLLFLTLVGEYSLSLEKITFIATVNFIVQLTVDLLSARFIDKIGYRTSIVAAHVLAASGLVLLALLPRVLPDPLVGILIAVSLYAVGGGIIEVLISPIVESCPTEKKEGAMSLLHSFYCWGQVAVVLLSTLFFSLCGTEKWPLLAILWALIPAANCFYFSVVPIFPLNGGHEKMSFKNLVGQKVFWLLVVIMVCAGASELSMSQWASAFAESALKVSKTVGDLAGPCAFGVAMGTVRALYGKFSDKLPLRKLLAVSAILCILCYLGASLLASPVLSLISFFFCGISVSLFWPGTFSIAAKTLPSGGTAMYALLALAGDLGCSLGPTVVGFVAGANSDDLKKGLFAAIIFPLVIFVGIVVLNRATKNSDK